MKTSRMLGRIAATLLITLFAITGTAHAAYQDIAAANGKVRVHYPASTPSQCTVLMLGVGTAMETDGYDKLAEQIIKYGHIVAVLDHVPGNMVKTDAGKYRALANEVKGNLVNWIGRCNVVSRWIAGGHSAGGQAAHNAMVTDPGLANAVFSIDPFDISGSGNISVPALYWGFDVTTCFVEKDKAAKAAYNKTTGGKRAFVRVGKQYSFGPCGYSPKYFHCSFCDNHCPACTNCMYTPDSFYVDVAGSVNRFIKALGGTFSKAALTGSMTTPATLFVNTDQP